MTLPIAAVVAGAIIDPTTFGNQLVDAINAAPRGTISHTSRTTQQTGITTATDITGLSVTFSAVAGRRYRVSLRCLIFSSVGGDVIHSIIADGSGAQLSLAQVTGPTGFGVSAHCDYVSAAWSGPTTVKARAERGVGTGSVTFDAGAQYPALFTVEDIGT